MAIHTTLRMLLASSILGLSSLSGVQAQQPSKPECIAPAQPGGGFDLTCRVAVNGFLETKLLENAMRTIYMPGGVGAVAYNHIVAQRPGDGNAIAAFSGGSLLNLAQGKFGKYSVEDVRWLASIGSDYGVAIVRNDSPYQDLKSLMEAFKADPSKIVLGAGGSVGGQDWMKAALTARAADVDFRKMRFVAFEGGGEAMTALRGGHIQAYMGDAAEAHTMLEGGAPIRVLAVFNDKRLDGALADIPTAKEQGFDIEWPIIRGFYVGPKVSDEQYQWWVQAFDRLMKTPEFARLQTQQGLFPFNMSGSELDTYVKQQVLQYRELADSFGLIKK